MPRQRSSPTELSWRNRESSRPPRSALDSLKVRVARADDDDVADARGIDDVAACRNNGERSADANWNAQPTVEEPAMMTDARDAAYAHDS